MSVEEAVNKVQEKIQEKVKDLSLNKKDKKQNKKTSLYLDPEPEFIDERIQLFEKLQKEYNDKVASMPRVPLKVVLKDGAKKEATAWETTPMDIAKGIAKSFFEKQCISKVNGNLWDLDRPLEGNEGDVIKLEFFDFESDEGKKVFWHSSAHVLGEACECNLGAHICLGPPTDDGFFYEFAVKNGPDAPADAPERLSLIHI